MAEEWDIRDFFPTSEYHSTEVEADASEWGICDSISILRMEIIRESRMWDTNQQSERISLDVETNLFDCDLDLYGQECRVDFYKYIRPEQKFTSFEALKAQIRRDIESGKNWFQEENRAGKNFIIR